MYEPRVGVLRAHRIGMTTRIVHIVPSAHVLVRVGDVDTVPEMLLAGTFWLVLLLTFGWVGSLLLQGPVHETLEGWHVENGCMWPTSSRHFLSP